MYSARGGPVAHARYFLSRRRCDPSRPQRAVARPRAAAARDGVPRAREEGLGGVPVAVPRADVVGGRLVLEWDVLGWVGLGAC